LPQPIGLYGIKFAPGLLCSGIKLTVAAAYARRLSALRLSSLVGVVGRGAERLVVGQVIGPAVSGGEFVFFCHRRMSIVVGGY